MITIGVDPDAAKHGVAVYDASGNLRELGSMSLVDIIDRLNDIHYEVRFSIEDNLNRNFVYKEKITGKARVDRDIARKIGMMQQAQTELMRYLDWVGKEYVLHPPQRGNWAKDKAMFERITGWTKRSNADTRSAAFFGFLALPK